MVLLLGRSSLATFNEVGGDITVSPKYSSLAIDETFDSNNCLDDFNPELTVIINAHYASSSFSPKTSPRSDVTQVQGRITVSF